LSGARLQELFRRGWRARPWHLCRPSGGVRHHARAAARAGTLNAGESLRLLRTSAAVSLADRSTVSFPSLVELRSAARSLGGGQPRLAKSGPRATRPPPTSSPAPAHPPKQRGGRSSSSCGNGTAPAPAPAKTRVHAPGARKTGTAPLRPSPLRATAGVAYYAQAIREEPPDAVLITARQQTRFPGAPQRDRSTIQQRTTK